MTASPTNIRALRDPAALELHWPGGNIASLPYLLIRENCPCAACVDEITGVRILDPATIPADIRPQQMSFAGNYALKITWSDGHDTGLFTWDSLRRLCDSPSAMQDRHV